MNRKPHAVVLPSASQTRLVRVGLALLCAALCVQTRPLDAAPALQLTKPAAGQSFTVGANIAMEAAVTNDGMAITRVEFYANGALLGTGVPEVYGEWQFPDGSHLSVMNLYGSMVDYTTPAIVWYGMDGTYTTSSNFSGTFTTFVSGTQVTGKAAILFTLSAAGRLTAVFSADAPLGNPTLTDGLRLSPTETHDYVWPAAAAGSYSLTARAFFAGNQSVDSPGVNITVGGTPPANPKLSAGCSGNRIAFTWLSQAAVRYQLQSATNLPCIAWSDEGAPLVGTGGMMTNSAAIGSEPGKFFRLQLLGN
jgi:hypothetical protein